MPRPLHFAVRDAAEDTICAALAAAQGNPATATGWETCERVLLDSADRRLARKDLYVVSDARGGRYRLRVHDAAGNVIAAGVECASLPRVVAELGDRRITRAVGDVLGTRALLPVRRWRVDAWCVDTRDGAGKLLGEVCLERHHIAPERSPLTLSLWPRRGYRRDLRQHFRPLVHAAALDRQAATWSAQLDACLAPLAGTDVRHPLPSLAPTLPLGSACARLVGHYRGLMIANEVGVCADWDAEFLHDYRVAMRRARTLMTAFAARLEAPATVLEGLAWLSMETSLLRDIDVWLDEPYGRAGADQAALHDLLRQHRRREQARLARMLRGRRYARVHAVWQAWLDTVPSAAVDDPAATAAGRAIRRRYRRLVRRLGRAQTGIALDVLHEVRKDAKKLRYLIEAFAAILPGPPANRVLGELKRLQDVAGRWCDRRARAALVARWRDAAASDEARAALATWDEPLDAVIDLERAENQALARRLRRLTGARFAHTIEDLCSGPPA